MEFCADPRDTINERLAVKRPGPSVETEHVYMLALARYYDIEQAETGRAIGTEIVILTAGVAGGIWVFGRRRRAKV